MISVISNALSPQTRWDPNKILTEKSQGLCSRTGQWPSSSSNSQLRSITFWTKREREIACRPQSRKARFWWTKDHFQIDNHACFLGGGKRLWGLENGRCNSQSDSTTCIHTCMHGWIYLYSFGQGIGSSGSGLRPSQVGGSIQSEKRKACTVKPRHFDGLAFGSFWRRTEYITSGRWKNGDVHVPQRCCRWIL